MDSPITIRHVVSRQDKLDFLKVPFPIFQHDPHWVAPLFFERLEHLDPKKNPYFHHADVQLFIAERHGKPVGRISAQADRLRQEHHRDGAGQFGFLDAIDDPAVFAALFGAAGNWLKSRGFTRMQGPFTFSINDETGLLIDGFDTPPNMMMGHARPYYGARVEEQGFAKIKDVLAYYYDHTMQLAPALMQTLDKAMKAENIVIRPMEKKHLARDLDIIVSIFNDAWSGNWGFVPFTREEVTKLGNDLKLLVSGDYVAIATYNGEPAAMAVTLPNLNDWIRGLHGRLLPLGWAKLARHLLVGRPRSVRVPLMGVLRKHHGTMLGSAMTIGVIQAVRGYHLSRGVTTGELSWILEDNLPMRRIIERLSGRPYKTYRVYEKPL
jgi:hypothetical protein